MRNLVVIALTAIALAWPAHAESFNSRLARGQALLNTGDADEAITIFRDLQVDRPESEVLQYGLGCAHYEKALKAARDNAPGDAINALTEAAAAFETASMTPDNALRKNAQYNKCTVLGQIAKQAVAGDDHEQTIAAFEQAISSLEDFLRRYPGHADAQTNLNNLRYELKKYLQQMQPPEQQEQSGSGGDQNESDQEQQQQQQDQQQGQDSQDQEQQDQQQQNQAGDSEQQQQQQEQQQQGESPEEQEQQQMADASEPPEGESQQAEMEPTRENIEAILDSLQETDEQQQKEMRQQPSRKGIDSKWW